MSVNDTEIKEFFGSCILDKGYLPGELPTMSSVKLGRCYEMLGYHLGLLDVSGAPTSATSEHLVAWVYNEISQRTKAYEMRELTVEEF